MTIHRMATASTTIRRQPRADHTAPGLLRGQRRSSTTSDRPSPCSSSRASTCSASRGCGSPRPRSISRCGAAPGAACAAAPRRALRRLGRRAWLMNSCLYLAVDRLPLGTVAAIEFLPSSSLAALGARTPRNLAALAARRAGIYLLTDVQLGRPAGGRPSPSSTGALRAYVVLAHRARSTLRLPDRRSPWRYSSPSRGDAVGGWAGPPRIRGPRGAPRRRRRRASRPRSSPTPPTSSQSPGIPRADHALHGRPAARDGDGHRRRRARPGPHRDQGARRRASDRRGRGPP